MWLDVILPYRHQCFFFNATATTETYTLSLHDALPICSKAEYKPEEVEDGTVDRDNQRKANDEKYGCYMTDAQIERGD